MSEVEDSSDSCHHLSAGLFYSAQNAEAAKVISREDVMSVAFRRRQKQKQIMITNEKVKRFEPRLS